MKKTDLITSFLMTLTFSASAFAYSDASYYELLRYEETNVSCTPAQIEAELSQAKRALSEVTSAALEYAFYAIDRDYNSFEGDARELAKEGWNKAESKREKFRAIAKGRDYLFGVELRCQNPEAKQQYVALKRNFMRFQSVATERDPIKSAERIEALTSMLPTQLPGKFLKTSNSESTGEKPYCSEQEIEKELGGAKKALDLAWAHALAYMGSANDYDYMNWAEKGDQELYELSRKSYSKKETYRNNFRAKLAQAKRAFSGKRDCKISHAKLAQMRFVADRLSALSDKQPTPARESDLADLVWETSRSYFKANRME